MSSISLSQTPEGDVTLRSYYDGLTIEAERIPALIENLQKVQTEAAKKRIEYLDRLYVGSAQGWRETISDSAKILDEMLSEVVP